MVHPAICNGYSDALFGAGCPSSPAPDASQPVIRLENVDGAFIHACHAPGSLRHFLQVEGERTRAIVLSGNALADGAVQAGASVPPGEVKWKP